MTDTTSTPTGLRTLTTPRKTWRRLGGASKFVVYTRVSLQSMPIAFLIGLLFPLSTSSFLTGVSAGWRAAAFAYCAVVIIFAVGVLELHPDLNTRPRRSVKSIFWAGVAVAAVGVLLSMVLQIPDVPESYQVLGVMVGFFLLLVISMCYLPWLPFRWVICLLVSVIAGIIFHATSGGSFIAWLFPLFFLGMALVSLWTVALIKEVEQSREVEASLRVTEERLRFAQELHDTLGQHLAAMSVKAELALALSRRGDARLEGELQDLQKLTRTSMSDMREVVEGYRAINLATEVEGARSLLIDAGISLTIEGDVLDVDKKDRELAAWFVREATTNVLRHSVATAVTLYLEANAVCMRNDGVTSEIGRLSGLDALRRRAKKDGARLLVEREDTVFTASLTPEGSV